MPIPGWVSALIVAGSAVLNAISGGGGRGQVQINTIRKRWNKWPKELKVAVPLEAVFGAYPVPGNPQEQILNDCNWFVWDFVYRYVVYRLDKKANMYKKTTIEQLRQLYYEMQAPDYLLLYWTESSGYDWLRLGRYIVALLADIRIDEQQQQANTGMTPEEQRQMEQEFEREISAFQREYEIGYERPTESSGASRAGEPASAKTGVNGKTMAITGAVLLALLGAGTKTGS